MKTIVSISNKNENVEQTIRHLLKHEISGLRINLAKYLNNNQKEELIDLLATIENYRHLQYIFDLPVPKKKIRIVEMEKSSLFVEKGSNLLIKKYQGQRVNHKNEILVDNMNLKILNNRVIYADGIGIFKIVTFNQEELLVTSESSVWLYTGKSFNSEPLYNMNDENLYSLCKQVKKKNTNCYFALSFSEEVEDIRFIKERIGCENEQLICKIETQKGVDNAEKLLNFCSGILLGRGDLLYYSRIERYYDNCLSLLKQCLKSNKQFYLCTDILMSLLENEIPNRSELIDVAVFKHSGCNNFILPAGFSRFGNLAEAIRIIKEI